MLRNAALIAKFLPPPPYRITAGRGAERSCPEQKTSSILHGTRCRKRGEAAEAIIATSLDLKCKSRKKREKNNTTTKGVLRTKRVHLLVILHRRVFGIIYSAGGTDPKNAESCMAEYYAILAGSKFLCNHLSFYKYTHTQRASVHTIVLEGDGPSSWREANGRRRQGG